ncbi:MAG: ribbon-helix-helix domain-containing protein [Alphaproteobacteria bacterium]|nr:ribbon-helix-helix domain-containing protein [Alphaproteobacteria bacterium]
MPSRVISRNVRVSGHRTSVRLESEIWEAIEEICRRENLTIRALFFDVDGKRGEMGLTAALRVFVLDYFRAAATEHGHIRAGHGTGVLDPGDGPTAEPQPGAPQGPRGPVKKSG